MSLTDKQQSIVDYVSEHLDATNAEVADHANCAESYASQVRREYRHLTDELFSVDSDKIWPIFSQPYTIYADEDFVNSRFLKYDDPVQIINNSNGGSRDEITSLRRLGDLDAENEIRGFFYATRTVFDKLSGITDDRLSRYKGNEGDDLAIHTPENLESYLKEIDQILRVKRSKCRVFVGIGLLHRLKVGKSGERMKTNNPFYMASENTIVQSLDGVHFIDDIRRIEAEPITPDAMNYVHHSDISQRVREQIKQQILTRQYIGSGDFEIHPQGGGTLGPSVSIDSGSVFEFTKGNVDLYQRKRQKMEFSGSIDGDVIERALHGKKIQFTTRKNNTHNEKISVRSTTTNHAFIEIYDYSINLRWDENELTWRYPNPFASLLHPVSMLLEQDSNIEILSKTEISNIGPINKNNWVFDTNALYHEIDENIGSSILRTVLANNNIAESRVHIPWIVLYEINKHKDNGGPNTPIQQNGVENLRLLKILSEYGFISLEVEEYTDDIPAQIRQSSVADLYLSNYAQEKDAVVVTGDRRLRKLNQIADVEAVNLYAYANVESIPDLETEVQDSVLNQIGTSLTHRSEIIDQLEEEIEQTATSEMEHHRAAPSRQVNQDELPEDAAEYLEQWVSNNKLIAYPVFKDEDTDESSDDGAELAYEQTRVQDVVPTMAVVSALCDQIKGYGGDTYLSEEVLDKISKTLNYQGNGKPTIHFHFPIASVISFQSTTTGRLSHEGQRLYKLKKLTNSIYTTEELSAADRDDAIHDSVLLAKERDCTLLCTDDEEYLQRIGDLLGVKVETYDS